jgi:hypothetical protein
MISERIERGRSKVFDPPARARHSIGITAAQIVDRRIDGFLNPSGESGSASPGG